MIRSIALKLVAGVAATAVALSVADAPTAEAQYPIVIETTTPARPIPPPPEARSKLHRANNPYFGLRSSYSSIRQYYSNPVKTIPPQTTRTYVLPYRGYGAYPYRYPPRYPYGYGYGYGYGYQWGFRR